MSKWVSILCFEHQKPEKQKNFWTREIGNPTGEEIGVPVPYMSSESRSVDLTNNGMVNHYLRDVEHLPTVFRDTGPHL
jgi:hypothetical protein